MNMKLFTLAVVGFAALSVLAESEDSLGRWSFSAGPAWRSNIKMSIKGQSSVAPDSFDMEAARGDAEKWTEEQGKMSIVDHPDAGQDMTPDDAQIWALEEVRYESAGTGDSVNDDKSSMGANFQLGYDFYQSEKLSIGLNARFAGYWNMKSGRRSIGSAFDTWKDVYIFESNPPVEAFKPEAGDEYTLRDDLAERVDTTFDQGGVGVMRMRGDLYQLGLGPKVAWTPFAGCESCSLDWLTIYGGVEALCNISHLKLEGAASGSSTDCLLGFGGNVGILANFTENLGLYGQVGYEWIDKHDYNVGGFKSEIDYSSLVISAGLQYRF